MGEKRFEGSLFSAFALWSAIFAADSASALISLPKSLTDSTALLTLSVTLSTPKTTLPTLSAAILPASLKLPLNVCALTQADALKFHSFRHRERRQHSVLEVKFER